MIECYSGLDVNQDTKREKKTSFQGSLLYTINRSKNTYLGGSDVLDQHECDLQSHCGTWNFGTSPEFPGNPSCVHFGENIPIRLVIFLCTTGRPIKLINKKKNSRNYFHCFKTFFLPCYPTILFLGTF